MTLIETIRALFQKREGPVHIQDLYSALPDEHEHSIRARIYERLGREFKRVGRGLYVAVNGQATCVVAHGDALDEVKKLPTMFVDCVITDPPYPWLDKFLAQGTTRKERGSWSFETKEIDRELGQELYRVLKEHAHVFIFAPAESAQTRKPIQHFIELMESCGLLFQKKWVWDKVHMGMGYRGRARYELVLFFAKGDPRQPCDHSVPDVISVPRIHPNERRHETEKPVSLIEQLIRFSTDVLDVILDPFAGSCSTGKAALNLFRNSILVEKSEVMLAMAFPVEAE